MKSRTHSFQPDYAVPPGETLEETLEKAGMTQTELARRTGRPLKTINEIVHGKAAITPETALQLERALGLPASLWNRLEVDYRAALARSEELRRLASEVDLLDGFPIEAMVRMGLITKGPQPESTLANLLTFFGTSSPESLVSSLPERQRALFRRSPTFTVSAGATAVWLRMGERDAAEVRTDPFDSTKFRESLTRIRLLTRQEPNVFEPEMKRLCAEAGVVLLILRDVPGTRASGATRWLTPDRAIIQLTIRGKYEDRFWFTFFHEAAHLLLHGRRDEFVKDAGEEVDPLKEEEANRWAADFLIPPAAFDRLLEVDFRDARVLELFAQEQGVATGIVIGRLQKADKLGWGSPLNKLKIKFALVDD